jgi:hypothetical protein
MRKGEKMDSEETPRKMVDNALKGFRSSIDSNERLSYLWNISQLIEDTTDAELYELAAVVATEDDPRLRGEICYAISRSRRPQLVNFIKGMTQDKNQYVRKEALTAISELNVANDFTMSVIESLVNAVNEIKSTLTNIQRDMKSIRNNNIKPISPNPRSANIDGIIMNDRMRCWETYLRNEKELLRDHEGEFVAIYNGEIVGISPNDLELAKLIHNRYGAVEAFIYKIEEEDKEPIQIPSYIRNIVEL